MKKFYMPVLALAALLAACQSSKVVDEKTGRAAGAQAEGTTGYYYDDMARYLAGFDLPGDSNLLPYTQGPEYAEHRQKMVRFWERVRKQSIEPITEWRESTLNRNPNGPVCRRDRAAIYPLCGADIINLYTICPQASEYVMIALEKAGDIPHPEKQTASYFQGLSRMRSVINNIADRNYFFSAHMKTNIIKNEEIPGIAPVLLAFTSGLGWRIVNMEKIYLAPDGRPVTMEDKNLDFKPRGVRIWFRTAEDPRLRSLTYIEQYLDSASVAPQYPLTKFLNEKKGGMMMLKAAVYLMHNNYYRAVREQFMQIPDVIVQDDSGFRYVDLKPHFDISIYGDFVGPAIKMSVIPKNPVQPELAALYAERKPPTLPFHFGYGVLRKPPRSNLMVAHRKQG
ncbi:MAG: hypothetical protein ACOY5B_05375 [Spirochaetota bacterium]